VIQIWIIRNVTQNKLLTYTEITMNQLEIDINNNFASDWGYQFAGDLVSLADGPLGDIADISNDSYSPLDFND